MIVRRDSRSEHIHSGHFMVSEIDESEVEVKVDEAEKSDGETLEMMTVKETEVDKVVCEETPQEYTVRQSYTVMLCY